MAPDSTSKEDDDSPTEEIRETGCNRAPLLQRGGSGAGDLPEVPPVGTVKPEDAVAFIDSLASMWRRRRIDQFVSATLRQNPSSIGDQPSVLDRKERDVILFGFDALNKAVLQHRSAPSASSCFSRILDASLSSR